MTTSSLMKLAVEKLKKFLSVVSMKVGTKFLH